jgi:xylulokinase
VLVPEAGELVALGAAVQAAWCLTGTPPGQLAQAWGTRNGRTWDPVPLDEPALARLAAALDRSRPLLDPGN